MANPYNVNWIQSPNGNAIKSGDTLKVTITGADHATVAIYENGLPINTDFDDNKDGKVVCEIKLLERQSSQGNVSYVGYPKGTYVLKTSAWINGKTQMWKDEFFVI